MNAKIGSNETDVDEAVYDASIGKWFYDPLQPDHRGNNPDYVRTFVELREDPDCYKNTLIDIARQEWEARDQQAKADSGKPKVSLVPFQIVYDIAQVREYGNAKYPKGGKDNWKTVDIQRYRDALGRHVMAYLEDPDGKDAESGIEHYKHIACNMAFICWMEANKKGLNNE